MRRKRYTSNLWSPWSTTTHHCARMLNSQQYLWIVRSASGSVGWGQSRCCDRKLLTWSRCKDRERDHLRHSCKTRMNAGSDCRRTNDCSVEERLIERHLFMSFLRQMWNWGFDQCLCFPHSAAPHLIELHTNYSYVQIFNFNEYLIYSRLKLVFFTLDLF